MLKLSQKTQKTQFPRSLRDWPPRPLRNCVFFVFWDSFSIWHFLDWVYWFPWQNPINPIRIVPNAETVANKTQLPSSLRDCPPRPLGNCVFCVFLDSFSIWHFLDWVYWVSLAKLRKSLEAQPPRLLEDCVFLVFLNSFSIWHYPD